MNRMKITAGLGRLEDFARLAAAGADELFAGFVPLDWLEKYGNDLPLNRREVLLQDIQIDSMEDMRILAEMKQDAGIRVALTFNSPFYAADRYDMICECIAGVQALGFDDWIIADPGLLLQLKKRGILGRIHISGEAGAFNADAVRFFRDLGATRIIFPRKISPQRMGECISAVPELEYESFALNEMCHFSGAFCSSLHCDEMEPLCRIPYQCIGPDIRSNPPERDMSAFGAGGCGLCAIPALNRAGVGWLKVVGRGGHIDLIERDVRLLRRALDEEIFDPQSLLNAACSRNCYYKD